MAEVGVDVMALCINVEPDKLLFMSFLCIPLNQFEPLINDLISKKYK